LYVCDLSDPKNAALTDTTDIDRQNLAAAKLQGVMIDLHLSTTQFATAISILFVG
jgi:hypothetical protein